VVHHIANDASHLSSGKDIENTIAPQNKESIAMGTQTKTSYVRLCFNEFAREFMVGITEGPAMKL
jgi:hypothetical protein